MPRLTAARTATGGRAGSRAVQLQGLAEQERRLLQLLLGGCRSGQEAVGFVQEPVRRPDLVRLATEHHSAVQRHEAAFARRQNDQGGLGG